MNIFLGAYEVWEIQWEIESIKDQIDVIGKSSRDGTYSNIL